MEYSVKNFAVIISAVMLFFFTSASFAKGGKDSKEKVLEQINSLAGYSCATLLNAEGKSKCDYSITLGKWFPYEPAWHTGQVINALVKAYELTGNREYLKYAVKAGDWWCGLKITDNPKLDGLLMAVHGDYVGDYIIFSTISDGTPGLFRLYRATKVKKYAEIPTEAGDWLLKHMYVPSEGVFYDAVNARTGEVMKKRSPFWPDKAHQTLFDVARPNNEGSLFLDMYKFTGNEKYKEVFLSLCNSLLEKQGPHGLWMRFTPNNLADSTFHPRFNLWYAESLLNGYELTHDRKYLDAAVRTLRTYKRAQQPDGTIYYKNYLDGRFDNNSVAGSAVAFAGILWMRLVNYGVGAEFKHNIELSYKWISRNHFAYDQPDRNLAGAVMDITQKNKKGTLMITERGLGSSFGLRFLVDYYDYKFGNSK